jgi:hypothetical protein
MVRVLVVEGDESTVILSSNNIENTPIHSLNKNEEEQEQRPEERARFVVLERMIIDKLGPERYQWDENFVIPVKALDGSKMKTVALRCTQAMPNNRIVMLLCQDVQRVCIAINVIFWSKDDMMTITLHTK